MQVGHDGFGDPSTGGHGHWLHHHLVTCNYGEPYIPLDWLGGTWVATEEDFQRRLASRDAALAPIAPQALTSKTATERKLA